MYKDQTLPRGTTCTQSEIRLWETLLQSADKEALKKSLYTFLQSKASLLTPENMQEIRQDFAQMVYSFLKQKEIQPTGFSVMPKVTASIKTQSGALTICTLTAVT